MPSPDSITITASNPCPFAPPNSDVDIGGTVKFHCATGTSGSVTTCILDVPTAIFTSGSLPYSVPGDYILRSDIQAHVTLHFNLPPHLPTTPGGGNTTNGTLNVGSPGGHDEGSGRK